MKQPENAPYIRRNYPRSLSGLRRLGALGPQLASGPEAPPPPVVATESAEPPPVDPLDILAYMDGEVPT